MQPLHLLETPEGVFLNPVEALQKDISLQQVELHTHVIHPSTYTYTTANTSTNPNINTHTQASRPTEDHNYDKQVISSKSLFDTVQTVCHQGYGYIAGNRVS